MSDPIVTVPQFSSDQKLALRDFQVRVLTARQDAHAALDRAVENERIFNQLLQKFVKELNLQEDANINIDYATLEVTVKPKS